MHLLQQVVAGNSNANLSGLCTGTYGGQRYLVYGSGARCIVYTAENKLVQVLRNPSGDHLGALAVAFDSEKGFIVASFGPEVIFFVPQKSPEEVQWIFKSSTLHDFAVSALSWGPKGQLLVAGRDVGLWHFDETDSENPSWSKDWSCNVVSEIIKADFSPDGQFFATLSQSDRLPKVWYKVNSADFSPNFPTYQFAYLPHPTCVKNISWRRRQIKTGQGLDENVLMTNSHDNVTRLWCLMEPIQPFRFHLGAVIDPATAHMVDGKSAPVGENVCTMHWLTGKELHDAINQREEEEMRFATKNANRKPGTTLLKTKKLKDALKGYSDILFHTQKDGSVVFWGIQHLTCHPRRAPKVLTIMKSDNTLPPTDFDFFQRTVLVFHNDWGTRESAIFFPAELQLVAQRQDGSLNAYTMNLDDFFATSWMTPRLSLKHSWSGHRDSTMKVVRHPNLPFVATVAKDGEIIIFYNSVPMNGLRTTDGLSAVTTISPAAESSHSQIAWLPHGSHFVLFQKGILSIYTLSGSSKIHIGELKGYDNEYPLLFLHAYVDPNAKILSGDDLEEHQLLVHLIGVSGKSSTVFVWALKFEGSALQRHSLISKTSLFGGLGLDDVSLLRALPTDDLCLIHYPQSPMGAHLFVTYSSDKFMRFWHCCDGSLASLPDSSDWAREALQEGGEMKPWRIVSEFEYPMDNLEALETDAFGKMSTVSASNGSSILSIWGNEATGLEMKQEWTTTLNDTVIALDWYFSSDGQHLLAVGMANRVHVYCQRRLASVHDTPTWDRIGDVEISWQDMTTTVAWLPTGSLMIATKHNMLVYDKWMDTSRDIDDISSSASADTTPQQTFSIVDRKNGRLPDHHPQLLIQYLLWGKYDFVRYSLSLLHCFVKMMVDAGRTITETPVPLWRIFADDEVKAQREQQYDALFDFGDEAGQKELKVGEFDDDEAAFLSEHLTRISLPNISNIDQMLLLAVIDTLVQVEKQKRSLDENGVRYVLFMRLFMFSQKSFPPQMKPMNLTSRDIAWGFFTDSQDILLDFIAQSFNNKIMWSDAKALGLGYLLRNPDTMRRTMETIARNQYMGKDDTRNPVDCSLFYIALRKKNVLLGLWKLASSHPEQAAMLRFLANDFEEERWKSAALKNAFALLGKQRYEYAVSFFLLADKLKDAVSVCLKQLNDPQLATILCRLYEGEDGPVLTETYNTYILPGAIAKGDRWLATMAFTIMKQRDKALFALLHPLDELLPAQSDSVPPPTDLAPSYSDPALLVFYHYLRRSYRVMRVPQPRIPADVETDFVYRSAQAYEHLGLPGLALDIIRKADGLIGQYLGDEGSSGVAELKAPPADDVAGGNLNMDLWREPVSKSVDVGKTQTAGGFDWGERVSTAKLESKADAFDWGEPVAKKTPVEPEPGGYDWGAPETKATSGGGIDWGEPTTKSSDGGGLDWGEPVSTTVGKSSLDDEFEAFKRSLGAGYDSAGEENGDEDDFDDGEPGEGSFGDEGEASSPHAVVTASEPPDPKRLLRFELEKRNMRLYKWMLAMRIVQAVYKSISIVSKNREVLQEEPTFRDYFTLLLDGMRTLLEIVEMPVEVMNRILAMRCREMDAIAAYVEIVPLHGTLRDYLPSVERFLAEECNTLARLALSDNLDGKSQAPAYVESLARQLLLFIVRWTEKASLENGCALNRTIACQTCVTAFMTLTVGALRSKDYQMLQLLVDLCDRFFDLLLAGNVDNLTVILMELSVPRAPRLHDPDADGGYGMDADSGPDEDDFEEKSPLRDQFQAEVAIMCDALIAIVSFQHIGLTFDRYLAQLRSGGLNPSDESHGFLCDAVLRPTSILLHTMQKALAKEWVCGGVKIEKIRKYLDTHEKKKLWDTLKKTISVRKMIEFVMQAREDEEPPKPAPAEDFNSGEAKDLTVDTTAEPLQEAPELIYRTADIIHTFALNPLDQNHMAIGTHRGILEIDVMSAVNFFQRRGTFTDIHQSVDDIAVRSTAARKSVDQPPLDLDNASHKPTVKRRDTLTRKLSFDSMQKAIENNMRSLRTESSLTDLNAGRGINHTVPGVSSLSSHPTLNYYLAGISDPPTTPAVVQLYQFGQPRELVTYTSGTTARFTRCRFDPFGVRFGASDSKGDVYLWRFDASADASRPAMVVPCHSSFTNDFTFLNSSSLLATAGVSTNNQNVCLWDTLLPTSRARVKGA
ncbi:RAVE protein 1 C terminal-domain-containing protein [Powellomyces hirtus]|nr:RAVE protein 1 C terminal-domain-containing protein [Powellomyces hirtus]